MQNPIICKDITISQVDMLIDYAWYSAIKYKFDPVAGKIHEDYLRIAKEIKTEILNNGAVYAKS